MRSSLKYRLACRKLLHSPQHAAPAQAFDQAGYVVGQTRKSIRRQLTGDGGSSPVHRPINQQRTANDILRRHEAPVTRVVAVIAVIAEDEERPFGDNQLAILEKLLCLEKPPGRDLVAVETAVGEIVPELVALGPVEGGVIIVLTNAIDVNMFVDEPHPVAGDRNNAFHEMLLRIDGIAKDNDVLPLNGVVRQEPFPKVRMSVVDLVHQKVVTDEQRLLHRLRRDLKRLHNKGYDEDRDDNRGGERLQRVHAARMAAGWRGLPGRLLPSGKDGNLWIGADFAHDGSEDWRTEPGTAPAEPPLNDCRYSQAFRAAPCSASFFVLPSLRRTKPLSPPADAATCASMVNSLR